MSAAVEIFKTVCFIRQKAGLCRFGFPADLFFIIVKMSKIENKSNALFIYYRRNRADVVGIRYGNYYNSI